MKTIVSIVAAAVVVVAAYNAMAVPRYSAIVPQIVDKAPRRDNSGGVSAVECTQHEPTAPVIQRIKQEALSCKVWSGTKANLELKIANAKARYGFENFTHHGRNATMLIPCSLQEMEDEIEKYGNESGWKPEAWDGHHAPHAQRGDNLLRAWLNSDKGEIRKYTNNNGDEVVYDVGTGRVVTNEKMGTLNREPEYKNGLLGMVRHYFEDVIPHNKDKKEGDRFSRDGDQYKYVGILYQRDSLDPDKYYIIDGQTMMRMTQAQVDEFPTTLSDMWKDMGYICIREDGGEEDNDTLDGDGNKSDTITNMNSQKDSIDKSSHPDLHSLDLDDPKGDWCKCEERGEKPGCKANMDPVKGYVFFGCTKCKKVNVKYAKMALELEQKMKDAGVQGTWFGQNAKENAHKAASEPTK